MLVRISKMPSPKILFVGALTYDSHFFVSGFTHKHDGKWIAKSFQNIASGMATNAAIAARTLGANAFLWSKVGDDPTGMKLLSDLDVLGISVDHIQIVEGHSTSTASVIVNDTGERWVIVNQDNKSRIPIEKLKAPNFSEFNMVMADVRWPEASRIALTTAKASMKPAILDADVAAKDTLELLASHATHILASADAAIIMTNEKDASKAVDQLYQKYGVFCCVTNGKEGCYFVSDLNRQAVHIVPPEVNVIDTNGAGDIFHGSFCNALCNGMSEIECLQYATVASALKCEIKGTKLVNITDNIILQKMQELYG